MKIVVERLEPHSGRWTRIGVFRRNIPLLLSSIRQSPSQDMVRAREMWSRNTLAESPALVRAREQDRLSEVIRSAVARATG